MPAVPFEAVLAAARLQVLVPDAVLVGDTAAALRTGQRVADDDHVLTDLRDRFEEVLATLEASDGWVASRVRPGCVILGGLDGVETGVLQLRRRRPLEVEEVTVGGATLRVPTEPEMLRVKDWVVVWRNATRDHLDTVALADRTGLERAGDVLAGMDDYYADQRESGEGVTTQLVRHLADPRPHDLEPKRAVSTRTRTCWPSWHISPVTTGHLLVVPKRHAVGLEDLPEDLGAGMFRLAQRLAAAVRRSGLRCEGGSPSSSPTARRRARRSSTYTCTS